VRKSLSGPEPAERPSVEAVRSADIPASGAGFFLLPAGRCGAPLGTAAANRRAASLFRASGHILWYDY